MANESTYNLMGGSDTIRNLVQAFYPKVLAHPELSPLFPTDILPVMERQYMFLTQFFGGPSLYTEEVGHPMMRARHLPFEINEARAQAWLQCMKEALTEVNISVELQAHVLERLSGPAYHFINSSD